ncbi:unnamed protein product, partial [marine sediment metagenome]
LGLRFPLTQTWWKSNPDERTTASDTDWYVSKEV